MDDLDNPGQQESAGRAILQIVVGAVVFAGLTGAYLWNANRSHEAQVLVVDAQPLVEMADVASLKSAAEKYNQALQVKPGNEKALAGLAEVNAMLWALHGVEENEADAKSFVEEARSAGIERAERYAADALVAYRDGRFDDAVSICKEVLEKGGVSERLNWVLGMALRAQGQPKTGRDQIRKAQDSKSGAPHYAVALGDAYDEDDDTRNAGHYWAIAANANSNYVPAVARNVMGRVRKGEDRKILEAEIARLSGMDSTLLGKQDQAAISLALAELEYYKGRSGESVKAAAASIAAGGETGLALYARGRALLADGKGKKGLKDIAAARTKSPGTDRFFYALARAHAKYGKVKDGAKLLNEQKEKNADNPKWHTAMGNLWFVGKDYKKALASYEKAIKINERYADALLGKGRSLWRMKKHDDATKVFEAAIGARSNFPEVYESIGLMWAEQGAASQANPQLVEAEKRYRARGMDMVKLREFYVTVIKTLAANRGSSFVGEWVEREKKSRSGT